MSAPLLEARAVGKHFGGARNFVAWSNAKASLSSVGSLHARPKNELPTGSPETNPAGAVLPPVSRSPYTQSATFQTERRASRSRNRV